jgi:four helix bundle protein
MALIERFEDIVAWQEARVLTRQIYQLSGSGNFNHDLGLRDQIRRASVSTMANIAEGFDCESKKEFARFLEIARRSVVEVQSLLYVALDVGHIDEVTFTAFYTQAATVHKLIGTLRRAVLKLA